jgi:xanthine dehydrogenase large subunit
MRIVGRPIPHESAREHVTGRALYTDDLAGRFPGLLHAWPVHSPHSHARVLEIRPEAALCTPGVVAVLTAEDVPGVNDTGVARRDEPLFPEEVMYWGQAVAWVLGETEEAAREGAERVEVTYEPLPAILTIQEAIASESFLAGPLRLRRGDPDRALATSPHVLEGEVATGAQEHFYLETQSAIAWIDEAGFLEVISSTQHPSETQEIVARVLGMPKNRVIVQCLRMGGGFGGKEVQANPWAAVAALGAWRTGRPVRVRLTRLQDFVLTGKRHPFLCRFRAGFDEAGKLLAVKMALYSDGGWSLDLSEAVLWRALFHADNAYFIPHMEVVGWVCRTHKTSQTAFRGFGGPQGMVAIEEVIDRVARTLGLPPEVVRERNLYREGQVTHYGQPVKDAERLMRIWTDLKRTSRFDERRAEIAAFNAEHAHRKRGIALTPVKFGISFTAQVYNQAGALVLVYQDGTVQVNHGGTEMGQGLHTKIWQIAAEALGVPLEWVRVMPTRTDKVPNTSATAASSGSDLNGAAVRAACETIRARLSQVAAQRFGVHPEDVVFEDGRVYPVGGWERAVPFPDVVRAAYQQRVPLFATGFYRTPGIHFDRERGEGRPFHYFAYGAAVTEVEVDGLTGEYRVLRVDILHDVGNSLSPLIDLGQIEGGFVQGMGWLTREEIVWDAEGRLATRGASTYKLPSVGDVPEAFVVQLLPRAEEPGVIYGSKAVGEPPLMLAISVREALRDAVGAFGRGGIVELGAPATPEAVFWAVERVRVQDRVVAGASD